MTNLNNKDLICAELLTAWQTVAAISERTGIHVHTAMPLVVELYNEGKIKLTRARIDGHNKIYCLRKPKFQTILGVVVEVSEEELA